ncbi:nitroreductase family protein [Oleidesulfovibrio sp.]|uniref:nitroreductase family protein n=1 Tax=Oleidesulfovibrio sp. TaxID=2909707 RepID=UPI003A8B5E0F
MSFTDILAKRRAVNFFDHEKEVSDAEIRSIIEKAALTPSSFNLQPWNVMILRDSADKDKLRKLAMNQPKVTEAPVVLIVLADRNGWQEGHPTLEQNFKQMVAAGDMKPEQHDWFVGACQGLYGKDEATQQAFAVKNTGFFAMSLMYAAADAGLDTHPMDGFDHDGVREAFNIPERFWIPLLLCVGHFDQTKKLAPGKWRKKYEDIVVCFGD